MRTPLSVIVHPPISDQNGNNSNDAEGEGADSAQIFAR